MNEAKYIWTQAAARHGVARDNTVFAIEYSLVVIPAFELSRWHGVPDPDLYIGPQIDPTAPLLEIMAAAEPAGDRIFHAMPARPEFLALVETSPQQET